MHITFTSLFSFISVPSRPRIIHCTHIYSSSLRVNWEAPTELNGKLLGYQLVWRYNGENFTKNITKKLTDPMTALVTGLSKLCLLCTFSLVIYLGFLVTICVFVFLLPSLLLVGFLWKWMRFNAIFRNVYGLGIT